MIQITHTPVEDGEAVVADELTFLEQIQAVLEKDKQRPGKSISCLPPTPVT